MARDVARRSIREDRSLDGAGFQAGVTADAVLGDDEEPERPLGVLALALLDAVDGADIHAGALAFADVLDDLVRHCGPPNRVEATELGACGRARSGPTVSSSRRPESRSPARPPRCARAPTGDFPAIFDTY